MQHTSIATKQPTILSCLESFSKQTRFHELLVEVREAAHLLIPNEGVVVHDCDSTTGRVIGFSDGDPKLLTHLIRNTDKINRWAPSHPLSSAIGPNTLGAHEFVLSDYISFEDFSGHPYYKEILRPINVNETMLGQIYFGAHLTLWLTVYRRNERFDSRARETFRQILMEARHVAESIAAKRYDEALAAELCAHSSKSAGDLPLVFVSSRDSHPVLNATATKLLRKIVEAGSLKENPLDVLVEAYNDMSRNGWRNATTPIWVEAKLGRGFNTLSIRCLSSRDGSGVIHLMPIDSASATRVKSKLTKRQSDVLDWVSQGKTNDEIAIILGLSRRTVEKHLQNIFVSLGVENRMAAAVTYLRDPERSE